MADNKSGVRATDDEKLATELWGDDKRYDEEREQYVPTVTEDDYNDAMRRHGTKKFSSEDSRTVRAWLEQQDVLDKERVDEVAGKTDDENPADKGGASSPGNSSPTSSGATGTTDDAKQRSSLSTAPTTAQPFSGAPTAGSNVPSTGGSGTTNQ